jgi:hypothetical protein
MRPDGRHADRAAAGHARRRVVRVFGLLGIQDFSTRSALEFRRISIYFDFADFARGSLTGSAGQ